MLKVNIQTLGVTNEPLPSFLQGLQPESLLDLSWTDSALGVSGYGWWPSTTIDSYDPDTERVTGYTYAADPVSKTATATAVVEPLSAEEIAAIATAKRKAMTPNSITQRQCRLQLLALDKLDDVEGAITNMGAAAKIDWEYANEIVRSFPLTIGMQQLFGWTDEQMDNLFIEAAKL